MLSPLGILAAVAVTALGIVAGLPVLVAIPLGVAVWGLRVAAAMGLQPRGERIDPFTLNEPWRSFVQDALRARGRFRESADRIQAGPLRDTLQDIANRLDTGVEECWRIARQGEALVRSRRDIDTANIDRELTAADKAHAADPDDPRSAQMLESLRAQRATADRMDDVVGDIRSQLRLLDARMGESVVRVLELSAQVSAPDAALGLSSDVDGMVTDLEALRQALEETHGTAGGLQQGPAPG